MFELNKVKLGVVPVRRSFLDLEKAVAQKERIFKQIKAIEPENIDFVGIDDVNESGLLWDDPDSFQKVLNKMRNEKIDALFMPHCDFGTEEVVAKLGKAMDVPFLLWGERDQAPVPGVPRNVDTQCGLFASSRALQRYGVPFSYIVNSELESDSFINEFKKFAAAASVVKSFKKMRIAQVSLRPKQFMSVIYNEGELLSKFGIEIVPVSAAYVKKVMDSYIDGKSSLLDETVAEMTNRIDCNKTSENNLRKIAALKLALIDIVRDNDCQAVALECWSLFGAYMDFVPCFVVGELTDMGIPVSCETDVLGAVTSVILNAAAFGRKSTFFADLTIRHPQNDNAELLWHCGPFPHSLKASDSEDRLIDCKGDWKLKNGDITIARFDGNNGQYHLFAGEGKGIDGPETTGTYVWFEVDNWEKWERKLIFGPYIHHVTGIYGNYSEILIEACKYIPNLKADPT